MPMFTDDDKKMMLKLKEWLYVGDDGLNHLKGDTPTNVRKFYEKMKKLYQAS